MWLEFLDFAKLASLVAALVAADTTFPMPSPDQKGVATRFGDPGDRWVGGNLYCQPNRRVDSKEHVCAHRLANYRGYPCGTILIIQNLRNKKKTWCRVMDRGPYAADVLTWDKTKKRYTQSYMTRSKRRYVWAHSGLRSWYVKIRARDKPPKRLCPSGNCVGRWRAVIDLSPAVSNSLGHNGYERVLTWRLKKVLRYWRILEKIKNRKRPNPS